MKQLYKYEEINGVKVIFFVNRAGSMWFGVKDGKAYGAHEELEFSNGAEDFEEIYKVLKQMAIKTL